MDEFAFALESPCTDIPLAKCIEVATYRSMESGVTGQNVADFYRGRYVFMTGGTGFIGKVLIEKLLRCCPDIAGIFVLMRPKKSRTPIQRGEDLCSSLVSLQKCEVLRATSSLTASPPLLFFPFCWTMNILLFGLVSCSMVI